MTPEKPNAQNLNADSLFVRTRKDLATLARQFDVSGWHAMRKDELIEALLAVMPRPSKNADRSNGRRTSSPQRANGKVSNGKATNGKPEHAHSNNGKAQMPLGRVSDNGAPAVNGNANGAHRANGRAAHLTAADIMRRRLKPAIDDEMSGEPHQDQLTATVFDAYWIHVRWCLTRAIIERAEAALGLDWHQALPVIRIFDVTTNDLATSNTTWIRDIDIHGEVDHWFVPVENPPGAYRLHIGYRTPNGHFFALARSNRVTTQKSGAVAADDNSWNNGHNSQDDGPAMFAPHKPPKRRIATIPKMKNAANGSTATSDFQFEVNAELVVLGSTHPDAELTLMGEPVRLNDDGTFSLRFKFPDGRQVIPVVVVTPNGSEQRTVVLGIERNTKVFEPLNLDEMLM